MPYAIEARRFGFKSETVRGTAETSPTYWLACTSDSEIAYTMKPLEDPALRGVNARYKALPGMQTAAGNIKCPVRPQNMGEFLRMLIGNPVSTEQAIFVVTLGVNDKIDFKENGGTTRTGTIAAGTYIMGTTSATVSTYCKAVKTAMEAAPSATLTYTVTYSMTTNKMTITASSTTVQIMFLTGTNTATNAHTNMGFTQADTPVAIAVTSDSTTVAPVFKHVFTPAGTLSLPSHTLFFDRSLSVKKYNLGVTHKIKFSCGNEGLVEMDASVMAKSEASGSIGSPSYADEVAPLEFFQNTLKFAGATPSSPIVKSWDITMDNGMFPYMPMAQIQEVTDFLAKGPFKATGNMVVYFEDETERAKFLAATSTSLEMLIAGGAVSSSSLKYTMDLLFSTVIYKAFPFTNEDGFLGAKVSFEAYYDTATTALFVAYLINTRSAYP